jgi:beta-galactosidase
LIWNDVDGRPINAHGGGMIYVGNKYYWFGEKRGRKTSEGVNVYSSNNLYNWKFEGLALSPEEKDTASDIAKGCIMERPKVIYNPRTRKYVMWFHLELKGKGYAAARAAVAVSDNVLGPYHYVNSFRPNGNMSRDMTLYVDDDGSAYQIYSSRENYDMRIVKLSEDFLSATTKDSMLFSRHREAPAVFKEGNNYFLITSGCTGWTPNRASVHQSTSLFGPWILVGDPMKGIGADSTFGGQSAYVQPVIGKPNTYVFIGDRWNPADLRDSRYLWLPVEINNGEPVIQWQETWNLDYWK